MPAGLVSHNITTAAGVTFAVISWVPDTAAPNVGAVPVIRVTDGVNVAPVSATTGLKVDGSAVTQPVSGNVTVTGIAGTAPDRGGGPTTAQTLRMVLVNEQVERGHYVPCPV